MPITARGGRNFYIHLGDRSRVRGLGVLRIFIVTYGLTLKIHTVQMICESAMENNRFISSGIVTCILGGF